MGSELVSDSPSLMRGGGEAAPYLLSPALKEHLPYYMAIGMTPDEYWDGEAELPKYYRKADELRRKRENERLWLQGAYVYEAIADMVPVLHAFAKKGAKPTPYPKEPYALTEKEVKERRERNDQIEADVGKAKVEAWAKALNAKLSQKKEVSEGEHGS